MIHMKFTKMQGTGNDFIVVDQRDREFNLSKSLIRKLSDRFFGIGFDQLLIIEKSDSNDADSSFLHRSSLSDKSIAAKCEGFKLTG